MATAHEQAPGFEVAQSWQRKESGMAQFPWKQRTQVAPGRCYTVVVSKLSLKHRRSIPGFMRDTLTIRRQLRSAPGLIGYSLLAELTNKTFWTFSAWENRDRLDEFAGSSPHSQITQGLRPKIDKPIVKFVDDVDGSQLPWGWAEVKRQLQENLG
jgi:heme-degrading monooxygenase HmoA